MAVLKKIRERWWPAGAASRGAEVSAPGPVDASDPEAYYRVCPLTVSHLDEIWQLDQRCFNDGEAYSRETFEYLLTSPDALSFRAVTPHDAMVGFIVGLIEPDRTGHITTIGVAPEHRRRRIARRLMEQAEASFRRADIHLVRLEVRSSNDAAQRLYQALGYAITQRLPRYYSNGGDGLLMLKSLHG